MTNSETNGIKPNEPNQRMNQRTKTAKTTGTHSFWEMIVQNNSTNHRTKKISSEMPGKKQQTTKTTTKKKIERKWKVAHRTLALEWPKLLGLCNESFSVKFVRLFVFLSSPSFCRFRLQLWVFERFTRLRRREGENEKFSISETVSPEEKTIFQLGYFFVGVSTFCCCCCRLHFHPFW